MTNSEEALAALILDFAQSAQGGKFKGTVQLLRERTEEGYGFQTSLHAFDNALEFLQERGLAKLHQFEGVDDYISVDAGSTISKVTIDSLASESLDKADSNFSFRPPNQPAYPIISTWNDVGSSWLHDYALSLAKAPSNEESAELIHSSSWTGRYEVSHENRVRITQLLVEMRAEIESLDLSNADRANALAAITAAEALSNAPDPAWALVVRILQSPILANLTAIAALIVALIKT